MATRATGAPLVLTRRELLRLPLAGALVGAPLLARGQQAPPPAPDPEPLPPLPRVNGGINLQPVRRLGPQNGATPMIGPDLVELQTQLLYELGFSSMRITLTFEHFEPNFLAAIPYVRAARALGIDVVGIMVDFEGFGLLRALVEPRVRRIVLDTYRRIFAGPVEPASPAVPRAGRFALQVLNEPAHFFGIPPLTYVSDFLAPSYRDLKEMDPELTVVAAASVGNVNGVLRVRQMIQAGLENVCDAVAFHVYSELTIPMLSGLVERPVLITESGAKGPRNHLPWVRDVFPQIAATAGNVEEIFYFDLFDLDANRWRVIVVEVEPSGAHHLVVESPQLFEYWRRRVVAAAGAGLHASFQDLVPDITAYFPTEEDLERVETARLELES